jgi:hypothetical protein
MFLKIALTEQEPLETIPSQNGSSDVMIKTASGKILIEPNSEKAKRVEAEIKKHPNALFFRSKAIVADEPNSNGDYFSEEELKKAYKTFEGVPFFTNHDNQHIENARGKNIFAEWVPEEKAVYVISFVDRDAYPHICRSIEEEYVNGVSMGCSVEYSECNICGNVAERTDDYCTHIRNRKGRKFNGSARNVKTGEIKQFKDEPVFEYNYGIKFIELSAVVDPACPSCRIEGLITNDHFLGKKIANLENQIHMVKTSSLLKEAGQEDVQQIENVLQTLEDQAVNLIQNRKQVEPEFASDLVEIITKLQEWLDELIAAGFANFETNNVPGTLGDDTNLGEDLLNPDGMTEMEGEMQAQPESQGQMPMPVSEEESISESESVGSVSGSPNKGPVSAPQLPISAPLKPQSNSIQRIEDIRVSKDIINKGNELTGELLKVASSFNKGEDDMAKRRTISEKKEQKNNAMEKLSSSWKEKQEFFEYIKEVPSIQNNNIKLSVNLKDDSFIIVAEDKNSNELGSKTWTYENLSEEEKNLIKESPKEAAVKLMETFAKSLVNQKEGENQMTDINKKAGAETVQKDPNVITEKQLDQKGLYHERTGEELERTTEKQLEVQRKPEQQVLTEKQLDSQELLHARKDTPETITQDQLTKDTDGASARKGSPTTITQDQLEEYRGTSPEVVTEKQLSDAPTPWSRVANRNPENFKSAKDHMNEVINVAGNVVISSGCTPSELCQVASSMVDSTKNRYDLSLSILESGPEENIDFAKRIAFWNNKNLKVASSGKKEIAQLIVDGLRKVASDETINPDVVLDALDVIGEGNNALKAIEKDVEAKLSNAETKETVASRKDEMRSALGSDETQDVDSSDASSKEAIDKRASERKEILASLAEKKIKKEASSVKTSDNKILNEKVVKASKADTIIETSFEEIGLEKTASKKDDFKKSIKSFAKGALASQNVRLASITNVTISGDTIQIAVQTDEGNEEVSIPVGEKTAPLPEETMPEGDVDGEGLENLMDEGTFASDKKMTKEAQSPMGGGVPQTPGGVSAPGAPEMGLDAPAPAEDDPIQSLTTGVEEELDVPEMKSKQLPPWVVCPLTGSTDVDVEVQDDGSIKGKCNDSGVEFEALMKTEIEYKILNPGDIGDIGGAEAPEEPEVPAMPVAAEISLDKGTITKVGKSLEEHGHVCPGCGEKHCEASVDKAGHVEYKCAKCKTNVVKDILVSSKNPEQGKLRVAWDVFPDVEDCESCKEQAARFASKIKVANMVKQAKANEQDFPSANCIERIARKYGGNTVGTFGPCKGKPLAECICDQLKTYSLRTVRHMERLAEASMQKDPMDECLEEQTKEGYSEKEAKSICGCLKETFASNNADNIYVHAFEQDIKDGREKILTANDLESMYEYQKSLETNDNEIKKEVFEDKDLSEELPPLKEAEVEIETEKETAQAMSKEKTYKIAESPKQVEDIEKNTTTPRGDAKMGEESAENIDVECKKPDVPRGDATMGQEEKSENKLPDVPVDSSYMGSEKETQEGMPEINNEIKGTVIAKKLKEVDTVEKNTTTPRGDATMGEEGKDNIDVDTKTPDVPRSKATMGEESEDNIDVKAETPDVPVDNSYMGEEKEVQKDMPEINDEMLKQVMQKRDSQLDRIAQARKNEAIQTTAYLASQGRIASDKNTFDNVVKALEVFEIDQISQVAETMFPIKTASVKKEEKTVEGHNVPGIGIMEPKTASTENDFQKKLSSAFTIGNKQFDESLTIYGEKDS